MKLDLINMGKIHLFHFEWSSLVFKIIIGRVNMHLEWIG